MAREEARLRNGLSQTTLIQRVEGLAFLLAAVIVYAIVGASWWLFALLLLAPDLSMAGYWISNQAGQLIYNIVHTYALPLVVALCGFGFEQPLLFAIGLIWLAHIGMDRAAGYGLKETQGFKFTHLGAL